MRKRITSLELCGAIRAQGFTPSSYSGRGMYGAECVGVSLAFESDLDTDLMPKPRIDSLGKGVILYWPAFKWTAACSSKFPEEA